MDFSASFWVGSSVQRGDKKEKSVEESSGHLKDSPRSCEVSRDKMEKRASYLGKTLAIFLEKVMF